MSTVPVHDFCLAFGTWLSARASVTFAATPRELWLYGADETGRDCAETFAVMKPYDASLPFVPVLGLALQIRSVGTATASMLLAGKLYAKLLDTNGRGVERVMINEIFRVNGIVDIRPPVPVNVDDKNRTIAVCNLRVKAVAVA